VLVLLWTGILVVLGGFAPTYSEVLRINTGRDVIAACILALLTALTLTINTGRRNVWRGLLVLLVLLQIALGIWHDVLNHQMSLLLLPLPLHTYVAYFMIKSVTPEVSAVR
jgi:hypothetical protein